jgi:hypothetical protein
MGHRSSPLQPLHSVLNALQDLKAILDVSEHYCYLYIENREYQFCGNNPFHGERVTGTLGTKHIINILATSTSNEKAVIYVRLTPLVGLCKISDTRF